MAVTSLQPLSDLTTYIGSDGKPTKDFYNWLTKLATAVSNAPQLLGTFAMPASDLPSGVYDATFFKDNPSFSAFRFDLEDIIAAGPTNLYILWASGGAWVGHTINCQFAYFFNSANASSTSGVYDGGGIPVGTGVQGGAQPGLTGSYTVYRPQETSGEKILFGMSSYPWTGASGGLLGYMGSGYWTSDAALDGWMVWTGGTVNITSGLVRVYGIP